MGFIAWAAWFAFPTLLVLGWLREDLSPTVIAAFVMIAVIAWLGIPRLIPYGDTMVTSVLALLDVVLVLLVFKGDVRIT